jgi:hypothetical protein
MPDPQHVDPIDGGDLFHVVEAVFRLDLGDDGFRALAALILSSGEPGS